jgi:serine/threonine-protein kinase
MNIRALSPGLALAALALTGCSFDRSPIFSPPPPLPPMATAMQAASAGDAASGVGWDTGMPAANGGGSVGPDVTSARGDDADAGPASAPMPALAPFDCASSAQQFLTIATTNCVTCHGPGSSAEGGFGTVLDVSAMIGSGEVVPGSPERSPVFAQVNSGIMPPLGVAPRPSPSEVETIRGWIMCGAPSVAPAGCQSDCTTFVDIDTRLTTMANDLQAQLPEARADVRYLDLSHFANAGHTAAQLDLYRDALAYTLNSLSQRPLIVLPQAIDAQSLIYRIKLSDYGWSAATWERLLSSYPYAITYDVDSRSFPVNEVALESLRTGTATLVPYLQGDWFFSHAVRPPLYYDLLGVPNDLQQLQAQLGVNIADDIAQQRVARAGFEDSGPSHFNRVIERHALAADGGVLWLTYDFDAGSGLSNVFTHPLDFRETSSEVLFSLPNGLHGYLSVDARGARLDQAPNTAVQDSQSSALVIEPGISCINCHAQTGVIAKHDEVHGAANADASSADTVAALYKDDATLDMLFAADRARFQAALTQLQLRSFSEGSAHALDDAYDALLTTKQIAGALGIQEQQLLAAINATPNVFPAEALALRAPGSTIARDRFEALVGQLVAALGLGTQVQP